MKSYVGKQRESRSKMYIINWPGWRFKAIGKLIRMTETLMVLKKASELLGSEN